MSVACCQLRDDASDFEAENDIVLGCVASAARMPASQAWGVASTGTNTDRLAEEKRRGITIDLGFADVQIGETHFAFIDVPGHEEAFKVTRPLDLVLAEAVLARRRLNDGF